jgi:SAM-dependent methyltransferase
MWWGHCGRSGAIFNPEFFLCHSSDTMGLMSDSSQLPQSHPRWEDPEIVAEFVTREPDHRLAELLDATEDLSRLRALDLGCAGGRNAELLARKGCSVLAVDLSPAMVDATRRRLAPIIGESEAGKRVSRASMSDLSAIPDGSIDLVVALGIYHQASSVEEWDLAMSETARVLRQGGRLLSAQFGPGTDLTGEHGRRVEGEDHVHMIREGSKVVLFDSEELDRRMADHGFVPLSPTATVERPHEPSGRRVTINALYQKQSS